MTDTNRYIIDCGADPFCPDRCKVERHEKSGKVKWTKEFIELYLSASQGNGKCIEGNKLRKELANKPVLNACVLDHLLAHTELIPDEWKGKAVFFWGTIYCSFGGNLYVRHLYGGEVGWLWHYRFLNNYFYGSSPAALSTSI